MSRTTRTPRTPRPPPPPPRPPTAPHGLAGFPETGTPDTRAASHLPEGPDLPALFDLFLGHRHLIEAASGAYETDFYYVANRARLVSSANVDHRLRKTPRVAEVHKLLDDQTELTERTHSDALLADFDEDLMYFFCHGAVISDGDATWQAFQFTDARSVHAGRIDSTRKRHTEANRRGGAFVPFHPMVVLNVCYAGSPVTGRFASLAGSLIRHGAQGVLAPHIAVPQVFGVEFALRFLTRYLVDRAAAGTAVRDTVRWFAAEYHNPLCLIYGLQCGLDSRARPTRPGRRSDRPVTAPHSRPHRPRTPRRRRSQAAHTPVPAAFATVDLDRRGWLLAPDTGDPVPADRLADHLASWLRPPDWATDVLIYAYGWQTGPAAALRNAERLLALVHEQHARRPYLYPRLPADDFAPWTVVVRWPSSSRLSLDGYYAVRDLAHAMSAPGRGYAPTSWATCSVTSTPNGATPKPTPCAPRPATTST